jgi:hypothetical protein
VKPLITRMSTFSSSPPPTTYPFFTADRGKATATR